jgi:putative plasmid recombination enzyme
LIKGEIKMAEISAINNFKKYNFGLGRSSINNVVREAFRELEKFKNNLSIELENTVKDRNVVRNRSSS